MALRAVEHTFTGQTNPWTATYDSTKTTLGDLMRQYTGSSARDKYAGPIRFGRDAALTAYYGVARPMETTTNIPGIFPHVVSWADKRGYYSTGTVTVSGTAVTGSGTGWLADGVPVGAVIGFGSTDPAAITTWYNISAIASDTAITLETTAGTYAGGTAFVINKAVQIDYVFLADNAATAATRRITLFKYDRFTSLFSWKGYITLTYPGAGNQLIRGMRAVYAKYTTGTVAVATSNNYSTGTVTVAATAVTGSGTTFTAGMVGMSIGFYTTNPASVTQWYVISAYTNGTTITLATTAGTVAAGSSYVIATTTVTGTGTTWNADRIIVGSRIGFGSTDPTQISQWHYVSALTAATVVSSDTSFYIQSTPTATGVAGVTSNVTYSAGTPYVIEDLRILTANTNGTTASLGGLFMTTGLSIDDFTINGTTLSAATSVDKAKAVFALYDTTNAANGNEIPGGVALDDRDSWTQQYCYVIEVQAATTPQIFKYNIRAPLTTVSSGRTVNAFVCATALQTVIGNTSSTNNGRVGVLRHGPGAGIKSLYFATTTRIYRAAITNIVSGNQSWVSDSMVEIPTGSVQTFNISSVLTSVEISDQIDRLIITGTGAGTIPAHNRSFITQYNTIATPFDLVFGVDTRQIDQSTASNDICPTPSPQGAALSVWSEGGLVYIARTGATALTNQLYAIPIGADWDFATTTNSRLITPALSTVDAVALSKVIVNSEDYVGGGALRLPTERYRIYYRTAGIDDNTGSWVLTDSTGNISGACATSQIQFMFEFRTVGTFCIPARIFSVACLYEDATTDTHYQPSVSQSSAANKYFAWRFSTAFGGTVPTLRIRLYDAVTGGLLLDDVSSPATAGAWEKSTDGGSNWVAYNATDKGNETTYIRYTPTSLGSNIKVRALLTQN